MRLHATVRNRFKTFQQPSRMAGKRLVTIVLLLLLTNTVFADPARLMVVHSYDADHVCGKPQEEGALKALLDYGWTEGDNLLVRSFHMDTKKVHTSAEAMRQQGERAIAEVRGFQPDVVLVLDDNAIREVMLPLVTDSDMAIVFSGMNGQPEDYNAKQRFMQQRASPGGRVTGIYERLWVSKSLVVIQEALNGFSPDDKVVGITDYSPTGNAITRQFELELAESKIPFRWELHRVRNFAEYKSLIQHLNGDKKVRAIYPAALQLRTEKGETYTAREIFDWTTSHSTKPEMALNFHFAETGLFGGAAVNFFRMGYQAGKKVARILGGEPPGTLPIEDAEDYAIVFNHKRAAHLSVNIPDELLTAADHVYETQDDAED